MVLLRGINVGGKNKVSMAALRELLESLGFSAVSTYIASGNVILESKLAAGTIRAKIEKALPATFRLDADLIKVLVLPAEALEAIVRSKPMGFGERPEEHHSDAIFLMDLDVDDAMRVFDPRDGVDRIWPGLSVIYSQRLSAQRTRSRLNKIMGTPAYRSMTIRSWQTTQALLELVRARQHGSSQAGARSVASSSEDASRARR